MKQKIKFFLECMIIVMLASVLITSGFLVANHNKKRGEVSGNPLDWSVDVWDGASIGDKAYLADYGNRGKNTITIESAESFMYFIEQVNAGNNYEGYTVYLNSNLDFAGNTIKSIGNSELPFKGVFDGSYYTIMNANIEGGGLFGNTENATIKNIGLYNVNVVSDSIYTGGLIGEAYNTIVENSFFRLGSIKGKSYVGGLVGLFEVEEKVLTISSCFADTSIEGYNVAGVFGKVRTDENSLITVEDVYYTTGSVYAEINNPSCYLQTKVMKPTKISHFANWDYGNGTESKWGNYICAENSIKLDFNYPILNQYVKVYTLGACYENVVYNPVTGEAENIESLTKAIESVKDLRKAEINIIVNNVVLNETATVTGVTELVINATKDTVISRGENVGLLLSGKDHTKIVLGNPESSAKLVIDGNRNFVEQNGLSSDALIQANRIEVNQNVVLQNNVNKNGNGGAIVLTNNGDVTLKGVEIKNCSASKGGAIYVSNDNINSLNSLNLRNIVVDDSVVITNCTAELGGAFYVEGNTNLTISDNIYGNNATLGKDIYFKNKSTITLTKDLTNDLSVYINNLKPYEETGRTNFDYSTVCYGENLEENLNKLKLENEGLKTTTLLKNNCISAYKGTEYNITYNTNGGIHNNPETYTCVDNVVFTSASKEGYEFLGWKEVKPTLLLSSAEEEYDTEITTGTLGDKEYEAVYGDYNLGGYIGSITVSFNDSNVSYASGQTTTFTNAYTVNIVFTFSVHRDEDFSVFVNYEEDGHSWMQLNDSEVACTLQSSDQSWDTYSGKLTVNLTQSGQHILHLSYNRAAYYTIETRIRVLDYNQNVIDNLSGFDQFVSFSGHTGLKNRTEKITCNYTIHQSSPQNGYGIYTYYVDFLLDNYTPYHDWSGHGYMFGDTHERSISFKLSDKGAYRNKVYLCIDLVVERTINFTYDNVTPSDTVGIESVSLRQYLSDYTTLRSTCCGFIIDVSLSEGYELSSRSFKITESSGAIFSYDIITWGGLGEYYRVAIDDFEYELNDDGSIDYNDRYTPTSFEFNVLIEPIISIEKGDETETAEIRYDMTGVDENISFTWGNQPSTATKAGTATFSWNATANSGFKIATAKFEILSKNKYSYIGELDITSRSGYTWNVPDGVNPPRLTSYVTVKITITSADISVTDLSYFRFSSWGGGYAIAQRDGVTLPENVVLPATYNGKPIVAISGPSYTAGDETYYENAFTSETMKTLVIPSSVTVIGQTAIHCKNLESITFANGESSLVNIGDDAMYDCKSLKNFEIPSTVTYIGYRAFWNCDSLTSVTVPAGANFGEKYGNGYLTFWDCDSLTEINVDPANQKYTSVDGVLMTKDKKTIITYPGGKSSTREQPYTIPDSVTTIKRRAFSNVTALKFIVINNNITTMEQYAFAECPNLDTVVWYNNKLTWWDQNKFPNWFNGSVIEQLSVNFYVPNYAFSDAKIRKIYIQNNVTYLGEHCFAYGGSLEYLYYDAVNAKIYSIGSHEWGAYYCSSPFWYAISIKNGLDLVIGPNVKTIPDYFMFYSFDYSYYYDEGNGYGHTNYETQAGPTYHRDSTTKTVYQLLNGVDFSNATSLIVIGEYAFSNNFYSRDDLNTKESSNSSVEAFVSTHYSKNSSNQYSITIPSNVMYVDVCAFDGCSGLLAENGGTFTLKKTTGWRYSNNYLTASYLYKESKPFTIDQSDPAKHFVLRYSTTNTTCHSNSCLFNDPYWSLEFTLGNYYVYNTDGTTTYEYGYVITGAVQDNETTDLVLPETRINLLTGAEYPVFYIADMKYSNNKIGVNLTALKNLTIPANYTSIGSYAFSNAPSLEMVTIAEGSKLRYIYYNAFYNCSKLTSINLENAEQLRNIYDSAFSGTGLTTVTLHDSITYLGPSVFASSGLTEFEFNLPNLTKIPQNLLANCTKLTTLTVGENVTEIGYLAFAGCTNLTTLYWNVAGNVSLNRNSDKYRYIFAGCASESGGINIIIGEKVTIIPQYFMHDNYYNTTYNVIPVASLDFSNAKALKTIGSGAFISNTISGEINFNTTNGLTIVYDAFYDCDSITKISGNVIKLYQKAFAGCDNLVEVNFENLETMDEECFYDCKNLKTVKIPRVSTIAESAFNSCSSLENVECENVVSIAQYAFSGCSSLTKVYTEHGEWYTSNNAYLGSYGGESEEKQQALASMILKRYSNILYKKDLYNFEEIYENDVLIGYSISAGDDIRFTDTITLPSTYNGYNIIKIADNGFAGVTTLKTLTIPNTITSIGASAFSGCSKLRTVNFGVGVTTIGERVFENCGFSSITIPINITRIEPYAFIGCSSLSSVYWDDANYWSVTDPNDPTNIEALDYSILKNYSNSKNYLTKTTLEGGRADKIWTRNNNELIFTLVTVDRVTTYYVSINPSYRDKVTTITIPSKYANCDVTGISEDGFNSCVNLQSISIAPTITTIMKNAFKSCINLTSIDLVNTSALGNNVFEGCEKLSSVVMPNTTITSIPAYTFYGCVALQTFTLPDTITSIGLYAFANSGLTSFDTNKVTTIYYNSFNGCTSLEEFKFNNAFKSFDDVKGETNKLFENGSVEKVVFNNTQLTTLPNNLFKGNLSIEQVEFIGGKINTLNANAFEECSNLTKVTFDFEGSQSNFTIGQMAFYNCTSLSEVVLPHNIYIIRESAFANCVALTTINFPKRLYDIDDCAFMNTGITEIEFNGNIRTIDRQSFKDCVNLETVKVISTSDTNYITVIYAQAFAGCTALKSVDISNTKIHTIQSQAFLGCEKLNEFVAPSTLTTISERAFSGCGFETISLIGSVKTYGNYAYSNNQNLTEIIFTNFLQDTIPYGLFSGCTNLVEVTIPDTINRIAAYAFDGCLNLANVTLTVGELKSWTVTDKSSYTGGVSSGLTEYSTNSEKAVALASTYSDKYWYSTDLLKFTEVTDKYGTVIGYSVGLNVENKYEGNDSLTTLTIPDTCNNLPILEISEHGFYECTNLSSIYIPLTVQKINTNAFYGCSQLTLDFSQLSNLTYIGSNTFKDCDSLGNLRFQEGLISIGSGAFRNCDGVKAITIPASVEDIGKNAFKNCTSLLEITVTGGNQYYSHHLDDNNKGYVLYNKDQTILYQYAIGRQTIYDYTVLAGVTTIEDGAFYNAKVLKTINSADNFTTLKTIEYEAFYNCVNLTTFDLSVNTCLESIGGSAFENCSKLTSIDLLNNTSLTNIGSNAFYGCLSLTTFKLKEDSPLEIIGYYAFADCNLEDIIIPENVICIYPYAYSSNLYTKTIHYYAKNASLVLAEWDESTGTDAGYYTFAKVGKNYETTVYVGAQVETIPDYLFLSSTSISASTMRNYQPYIIKVVFDEDCVCSSIGKYAFRFCYGLSSINLEVLDDLYSIGEWSFKGLERLKEIKLPANLGEIGKEAFRSCPNLTSIDFGENIYNWKAGDNYLEYLNETSVAAEYLTYSYSTVLWQREHDYLEFSGNTVKIKAGCKDREVVVIPRSYAGVTITAIKTSGFQDMPNLKTVVLPNTITAISSYAFSGCSSLENINLTNITYIYGNAFNGCTSLTEVDLSNINRIYAYGFNNCTSLSVVNLPKIYYLLDNAFNGCTGLLEVYIGQHLTESLSSLSYVFSGNSFAGCENLQYIEIDVNNKYFSSVDGVLYNKNKTALLFYPQNKAETEFELPMTVHTIGNLAFSSSNNLTTLNLSYALTRIGYEAFKDSSVATLNNLDTSVISWYRTTDANFIEGTKLTTFNLTDLKNNPSYYYYRNDTSIFEFNHESYEQSGWEISIKDEYRSLVTSIVIPSEYTGLGYTYDSYSGEYSYDYVTLPVKYVIDFQNCVNLEYVYIPETISAIWLKCFEGCTKLKTVYIDSNFDYDSNYHWEIYSGCEGTVFSNCGTDVADGMQIIFGENVTSIPGYFLQNIQMGDNGLITYGPTTANLTKITFAGTQKVEIGAHAFENITTLKTIENSSVISLIGDYAFYNCNQISEFDLSNVTSVGDYGMYGCSSLEEVDLSSATNIGNYAFANCTSIKNLEVSGTVGTRAFSGCSSVETLTIAENITNLPEYVFAEMNMLTTINFNAYNLDNYAKYTNEYLINSFLLEYITNNGAEVLRGLAINNHVFDNAGTLGDGITVNIGEKVQRIPANLFSPTQYGKYAPNIKQIVWANKCVCTVIGNNAFAWLDDVTTITIPESIQYIGDKAFYENTNVSTIYFNAKNCYDMNHESFGDNNDWGLGNYTFHNVGLYATGGVKLVVGSNVRRIPANFALSTRAGSAYAIRLTSIDVDNAFGLTEIGEYAFYDARYLKSITIPENIKKIGNYAFYYASFVESLYFNATEMDDLQNLNGVFSYVGRQINGIEVVIGLTVQKIPAYLFCPNEDTAQQMPYITKVTFGNGSMVKTIGDYAFRYCISITSMDLENCESLETIGNSAFRALEKIEQISIPRNVKNIGDFAFGYMHGLTKITLNAAYLQDLSQYNGVFVEAGFYNSNNGDIDVVIEDSARVASWVFYSIRTQITSISFEDLGYSGSLIFSKHALQGLNNVTELTIPETTSYIGAYAFHGMTDVNTIYYNARHVGDLLNEDGSSAKSNDVFSYIGNEVFYEVDENGEYEVNEKDGKLIRTGNGVTVHIGANVTRLPANLFYSTVSNEDVGIPKITKVVFETTQIYELYLSHNIFNNLRFLKTVEGLENQNFERLGDNIFNQCYELETVSLPKTVKNIGFNSFKDCKTLSADLLATIPNVVRINAYAFYGCESLTTITIPRYVTFIGNNAFEDCINLETINWNATLENYDDYYMGESNLRKLTEDSKIFLNAGSVGKNITLNADENVEEIPAYLFYNLANLKTANIESIWEIGEYAFCGSGLTNVTITEGDWNATNGTNSYDIIIKNDNAINILTKTKDKDKNCYANFKLTNTSTFVFTIHYDEDKDYYYYSVRASRGLRDKQVADIPSEYNGLPVEVIEEEGFANYDNLSQIYIPESIKHISTRAFADCDNLMYINYDAKNATVGDSLFADSGWKNGLILNICENVEVVPKNFLFTIYEYYNNDYYSDSYYIESNVIEINFLGNNVKRIEQHALAGAINVTSLTIPASVEYIGQDIFGINYNEDKGYYPEFGFGYEYNIIFENATGWTLNFYDTGYNFDVNEWTNVGGAIYRKPVPSGFFYTEQISSGVFVNVCEASLFVGLNSNDIGGYWFERGSDRIKFILDHGEDGSSNTNEIYQARSDKSWYSGEKTETTISSIEIPEHLDEDLTFMGYYYEDQKIIDWNGEIVITAVDIDYDNFKNEYTLTARWEKLSLELSSENNITTIEYDSNNNIILNANIMIGEDSKFFDKYTVECEYKWFIEYVELTDVTVSTFTHSSTSKGVGSYTYRCEVSIYDKTLVSNEITIIVTYGILGTPVLTPNTFKYDGFSHCPEISQYDSNKMEYVEGYELYSQTEVGNYQVRLRPKANYAWSYDSESGNYDTGDKRLSWSITGHNVTLLVDETYSNGTLSYTIGNKTYSSAENNVFTISSATTEISANADSGYGFFYYTIIGETIKETVYNTTGTELIEGTMFAGKFNLSGIEQDVTVTGYFVPVITLNVKIERENDTQGLISYDNLISHTKCIGEQQDDGSIPLHYMKFTYTTDIDNDNLEAVANVFAHKDMIYSFTGTSDVVSQPLKDKYNVISVLSLGGNEIHKDASLKIQVNYELKESINELVAGQGYDLVYRIVEMVSLKEVEETQNVVISVVPNNTSEGLWIDGDLYVKPKAGVKVTVTGISEGYTFVGFKSGAIVYPYNDPSLNRETITGGETYSFNVLNSMQALVLKNFTDKNEISVDNKQTTLTLTHTESLLKYSLDGESITSQNDIFAKMMQGTYQITGLISGSIKITIYGESGEVLKTNTYTKENIIKFNINDTNVKVSIEVIA